MPPHKALQTDRLRRQLNAETLDGRVERMSDRRTALLNGPGSRFGSGSENRYEAGTRGYPAHTDASVHHLGAITGSAE